MKMMFWVSLTLLLYTFLIYPSLLLLFTAIKARKGVVCGTTCENYQPRVSFIIAAHNEEKIIEEKIINTLALDYPPECIQIIVVSDNSNDSTNDIVKRYQDKNVLLLNVKDRKGKTHAQNMAVLKASGEILVFTDANSMWAPRSLQLLVNQFADNKAGYVCGQLRYADTASSSGYSEGLYWKYEMFLRGRESLLHSVTAGNGAIYAVRACLYPRVSPLYSHDLELPHRMVAKGKLAVYEPQAIAFEKAATSTREEYRRKIRMLSRTWHRILHGTSLYNPFKYGAVYTWMMVSHRLLRYLVPFFQLTLLASSFLLWGQGLFYRAALMGQVLFYLLAALGAIFHLQQRPFYLAHYFCMFNFASLAGFYRAVTGKVSPIWEKAQSTR